MVAELCRRGPTRSARLPESQTIEQGKKTHVKSNICKCGLRSEANMDESPRCPHRAHVAGKVTNRRVQPKWKYLIMTEVQNIKTHQKILSYFSKKIRTNKKSRLERQHQCASVSVILFQPHKTLCKMIDKRQACRRPPRTLEWRSRHVCPRWRFYPMSGPPYVLRWTHDTIQRLFMWCETAHDWHRHITEEVALAQQPEAVVLDRSQGRSGRSLCVFGRHCFSAKSICTPRRLSSDTTWGGTHGTTRSNGVSELHNNGWLKTGRLEIFDNNEVVKHNIMRITSRLVQENVKIEVARQCHSLQLMSVKWSWDRGM